VDTSFFQRHRFLVLGAAVCLAPLILMGALRSLGTNANDVRTWLPQELPESIEYARFTKEFGSEEFVAVSWEGCTLDDVRLQQLKECLTAPSNESASGGQPQLVEAVLTGPSLLDELTSPPLKLPRALALARLRGFAIGPDGKQSCAVVQPSESGKQAPHELLDAIHRAAQKCGVARSEVRMAGPLVVSVAVDETANSSLNRLGPPSMAIAIVLAWLCFRSLRLTLMVIAVSVFSAATALAVLWFSGGEMNAVLVTMPPLIYVATMSGAIHWSNYYRDTVNEEGRAGAPERAVGYAWLPLALATSTTALGLSSLCSSDLLPIREFGFYSAIGVVLSLVWLLVVLPSLCAAFPPHLRTSTTRPATRLAPIVNWSSWSARISRVWGPVTVAALLVAAVFASGLYGLKSSVTADKFFSDDAAYPRNCRWLEERLGGSMPMEVILRINSSCRLDMLRRMQLTSEVQNSVASLAGVGTTISAATFGPQLSGKATDRWSVRHSILNGQLEKNRDYFERTGFLTAAESDELWRISLRTNSFDSVDQRDLIDTVRQRVDEVLAQRRGLGVEGVAANITGMVPLIERSQQSLLEGLIIGLTTDVALIVIGIIVLMRHWSVGLVVLVACVLPIVIVLGLMSWLRIPLSIGSVLAPAVALGVTVDDVVHFVLWFRKGVAQGMDRQQAIGLAYETCARAMVQSWAVIGFGLAVFGLSDFAPTRHFGWLMISLLSVGLVVNLVVLPALLVGPLGGFLAHRVVQVKETAPCVD
jgi:predicted RND superfamily exporter protein